MQTRLSSANGIDFFHSIPEPAESLLPAHLHLTSRQEILQFDYLEEQMHSPRALLQ